MRATVLEVRHVGAGAGEGGDELSFPSRADRISLFVASQRRHNSYSRLLSMRQDSRISWSCAPHSDADQKSDSPLKRVCHGKLGRVLGLSPSIANYQERGNVTSQYHTITY